MSLLEPKRAHSGKSRGWLSRKYGMTIGNLESAEVVTAAGEVVRASTVEHPELFWALRGGSGNFGVVTLFEFRLHPVGPHVLSSQAGLIFWLTRKRLSGSYLPCGRLF
jgi:FAD/FMN-containing dehydrogenase